MRWSAAFIPTTKEAPADATAISHQLLVRAGYIRQLHAGHYTLLPLGFRVHERVARIVRQEMDAIGAQEFHLPAMHPAELWERSGRWSAMGDEMFRLADRHGRSQALAMTHEEAMAFLATGLSSYRQLPQLWYQIQFKFRDEPRPKGGLLRVREFAMKDSYSFDIDVAGLDRSFEAHHDAYVAIFGQLGLDAVPVEASSGAMGGSASVEFMVPSPAGEDDVAICSGDGCDYRANVERAVAAVADEADPATELMTPERFATPDVRTIDELAAFEPQATARRQLKTMVMVAEGEPVLAVVRGDHQLNMQKLADALGTADVRPAGGEEAFEWLGAHPGSLGAVGVTAARDATSTMRVLVDDALAGRSNMFTGANDDDWHLRGVDVARDVAPDAFADLREVSDGEPCVRCGQPLRVVRCIETGHIFKLGRKYAEAFELSVLDADGKAVVPIMGSYGIGIGRAMAAIAEVHHDDAGLVWPASVAPFDVVISLLDPHDAALADAAQRLARELSALGVEVLLDDRDARPGIKFAEAELVGIPLRVTVGAKAMASGEVEVTPRRTGEHRRVSVDDAVAAAVELLKSC